MKPDRSAAVEPSETAGKQRTRSKSQDSPPPTTNLLIADIVLGAASGLLHKDVDRRVAKAEKDSPSGGRTLDGRTILTTLALYGASRVATRSVPGLALVAGGLALKTLYDRGKARELAADQED